LWASKFSKAGRPARVWPMVSALSSGEVSRLVLGNDATLFLGFSPFRNEVRVFSSSFGLEKKLAYHFSSR
jgi:hypothetical protein